MSKLDELLDGITVSVANLNYELSDLDKGDTKDEIKELFYKLVQSEFDYEISSEELAESLLLKIEAM